MENIICIENAQIKTKIKNFIKTCDSLLSMQKELDRTLQAVNAFKVLLRFLKNDSALIEVYNRFDASGSITAAYILAKEIADNDYSITVACPDPEPEPTKVLNFKYKIDDIIPLGKKVVRQVEQPLTWKVINTTEGKALLFAEKSYLWEPFDTNGNSSWAESSIRNKLNSEWINEVFSEAEQDTIIPNDVQDLIFVPSLDLLVEFIPNAQDRCDSKASWWTTSQGDTDETLVSIQRNGEVQSDGTPATKKQGVRPAFWIVNPVEEVIEEAKPIPEAKAMPLRKVIIVEDSEDFYIACADSQDAITSLFLRGFSMGSAHYETLEDAQEAADVFKHVSVGKYEVVITHIVLAELLSKEFEAANQKCIISDSEGNPVVYIDSKGKQTFPVREEDISCHFIDKIQYEATIKQLIENYQTLLDETFDYSFIGKITGYEVALDCDAPHIRYEIFKAQGMIEGFDEYPELQDVYVDDNKYYNGYIDALTHALNIQKSCIFTPCNWVINIVDLRTDGKLTDKYEMEGDLPDYGHYKVRLFNDIPVINYQDGCRHVVVAFVHKKIEWIHRDTELALNLPQNVPLIFGNEKMQSNKSQVFRLVKSTLYGQCVLGAGDPDYRISANLVPALVNYSEYFKDDAEDEKQDGEEESSDNVEQVKAIDLRFVDASDVLYDYRFKDNRVLRSIKMPVNLKALPEGLFFNCKNMDYITLPENLRIIGVSTFEGCTSLWKLFLPNTVRRIEDRAFFACSGLKKIYLPSKLEYIGSQAFSGCLKLSKVFIPASVKYIADDAFEECFALTKISAPMGCKLPEFLLKQAQIKFYSEEDESLEYTGEDEEDRVEEVIHPQMVSKDFDAIEEIVEKNEADTLEAQKISTDNGLRISMREIENNKCDKDSMLNNVLLLLNYVENDEQFDLSSSIKLLTKEYKNDQV